MLLAFPIVAWTWSSSLSAPVERAMPSMANVRRVMLLGDSITHGGFYEYYLQLFENLRHPGSLKRYYNAGYSGGTLQTALDNCACEIERVKPDCVFVMYGMNDVGWTEYGTNEVLSAHELCEASRRESIYRENLIKLLGEIREGGITNIVLVTPTPYDEYSKSVAAVRRRNVTEHGLMRLAQTVRNVAKDEGLPVVDLHVLMLKAIANAPEERWCGADRVHPGRVGHLFMAFQFLNAFGEKKPVADVALAADGSVDRCVNACVRNVSSDSGGLAFDYEPAALPLPNLPEYKRLTELHPEMRGFNCERLSVRGLADEKWRLLIDGREIGAFSAQQLADGVNLADFDTPNRREAEKAGVAMFALHDFDKPRRCRACARLRYEELGAKLGDRESVRKAAEKNLAELKAKNSPWYESNKITARLMIDAVGKEQEIAAEEERLYSCIAEVRPHQYRVGICR